MNGVALQGLCKQTKGCAGEHLQRLECCAQRQRHPAAISLMAGLSQRKSLILCSYVIEEFFQSDQTAANRPSDQPTSRPAEPERKQPSGGSAEVVGGCESDSARPPFAFHFLLR